MAGYSAASSIHRQNSDKHRSALTEDLDTGLPSAVEDRLGIALDVAQVPKEAQIEGANRKEAAR
jgi:hypothetical protein